MQDHLEMTCAELKRTQTQLSNTQETTRNLEKKVEALQRQLEEKKFGDRGNENTRFIWRIDKLSGVLRPAKKVKLLSEKQHFVFFTEDYGYKFKMSMNPNFFWIGFSSGPNKGLSASVCLIKGEYDAILPWPFNRKVILSLIDQQQDPEKRKNLVQYFDPERTYTRINRPKGEESAEIAALMISREKLETSGYIVDDTLFLQVEVGKP